MIRFWPLLIAIGLLLSAEPEEFDEDSLEAASYLTNGIIDESNSQLSVEAHDMIVNRDLEGIQEYTSMVELADAVADFIFKHFPALDPMNEDRILLKFQLEWIISTQDHKEIKGMMQRYPKYFKPFNTRHILFRKIIKDQFAKISDEDKYRLQLKTDEEYYENLLKGPFMIHLAKKIAMYKKRGLNSERRKKEIQKKKLELLDQWNKVIKHDLQPFLFHHLWKKEQKTGERIYIAYEDAEEMEEFFNKVEKAKSSRKEEKGSTERDDEEEEEEDEEEETNESAQQYPATDDEEVPDTDSEPEELTYALKLARTGPAPWYYKWEEWKKEKPGRQSIVNAAFELVHSDDLQGLLNYTSLHELADVVVESTRKEYPSIDPRDDKTLIHMKLQVAWMLSVELEESYEVVKRFHFIFAPLMSAFSRLIDITEMEMAKFPDDFKKNMPEDPRDYLKLTLYVPVCLHLAQKMVYFEENGWSREEIKEIIRAKEQELMKEWRSWIEEREDPEVLHKKWKKEKEKKMERLSKDQEKRKLNEELVMRLIGLLMVFTLFAVSGAQRDPDMWDDLDDFKKELPGSQSDQQLASELLIKENLEGMLNYTSTHELADAIVDYMCEKFPDLYPEDDTVEKLLKLQVSWMLSTDRHEQEKVIDRFTDEFETITSRIAQLFEIATHEVAVMSDDSKQRMDESMTNPLGYLRFMVYAPVFPHLAGKIAHFREQGLSKEDVQLEIKERRLELAAQWENWAEDSIDPEILHAVWKKEQKTKGEQTTDQEYSQAKRNRRRELVMRRIGLLLALSSLAPFASAAQERRDYANNAWHLHVLEHSNLDDQDQAVQLAFNHEIKPILEYVASHELAEVLVEHLSEVYPEVAPGSPSERVLLKRQISWMLTADDQAEVRARFPDEFEAFDKKWWRLGRLAQYQFETMKAGKRKQYDGLKSKNDYLTWMIQTPVYTILIERIADYRKRGVLSAEQRKEEIKQKQAELDEEWAKWSIWPRKDPLKLHKMWKKEQYQKKQQPPRRTPTKNERKSRTEEL